MEDVIRTNTHGPREVLPDSLWVGLTRLNRNIKGWHAVQQQAYDTHQRTSTGTWLPNEETSGEDLQVLSEVSSDENAADYLILPHKKLVRLRKLLGSISLSSTGCWVPESEVSWQDFRLMTEADTAHTVLEHDKDIASLRVCDSEACLYHRHYDTSSNVPSGRRELVYPNRAFYHETPEAVLTAWGDKLPSVAESRDALIKFSRKCMPHANPKESLLTATGISQINIIPVTGCWFVRSYYHTPTGQDSPKGWQWDGYGRLKIPNAVRSNYNAAEYSTLAHRITWALHDKGLKDPRRWVLNHMCGFRPCANPEHLVQVSQEVNTLHGVAMETARRMISKTIPVEQGIIDLQSRAARAGTSAKLCYEFWARQQE